MITETLEILSGWGALDTWIAITAAMAAMACALPGNFLVLRRQSMMGDALSHTVLPGIALAFLLVHALRTSGLISVETYAAGWHTALFTGAILMGMVTAVLTESVQKLGRVESSAALGVVFTTLFALGLVLIRMAADNVHIDPDCVLYGSIETVVMDTIGDSGIPRAAVLNAAVLGVNLLLVAVFFKELKISAFDPNLASSLGISGPLMHYALMAVTAVTLVSVFESVGSILVIAMLIVPSATAYLLTRKLSTMIALSLIVAGLSAVLGHVLAITLPPLIFSRLGFPSVIDASTAGMMAVAAGVLFVSALVLSPQQGLVARWVRQTALRLRIAGEDVLGILYRMEEMDHEQQAEVFRVLVRSGHGPGPLLQRWVLYRLGRDGKVNSSGAGYRLSATGRAEAANLVRSHRLWEAYMAAHFQLANERLHASASKVEHYIGPELREELATELNRPQIDPHGRVIPPQSPDQR